MEPSEKGRQEEEPFNMGKATDFEVAMFYSSHIDNPCEAEAMGETKNIRDFYIRAARQLLDESNKKRLMDPDAREILKNKIKEYEE